ncbi:MAG: 30S ribosomal protein S2 [Planctomycetota bacterium]|nr:30S ribosomal protein S2 [Planctomycetota bacterium]
MAAELVKQLIDAGIHFGHRASRWNPKMKPYIFSKRNLIHVIDLKETLKGVLLAKRFLTQLVARGQDVLLVGTKRQARKATRENASRVKMHWVNDRWLGGTLTNFREIRKRIGRLEELEALDAKGLLDQYSKKEGASLRRQMRKIQRNLGGLRNMTKLPGAIVVVDQHREIIAVREANKLNIPVICLLDTDCDPDLVDIPIPGNDDAMRVIELIMKELCDAIHEGLGARKDQVSKPDDQPPRRRSRRRTTACATDKQAESDQPDEAPSQPAPPEPTPEKPAAEPEQV